MTRLKAPLHHYPVVIVEDRYGGVYSGGLWLAISAGDYPYEGGESRIDIVLLRGPHGDDVTAMEFWADPPAWVAVGDSPDSALRALCLKQPVED